MERELVTSRANPLLARVRKLNSRRAFRRAEGSWMGQATSTRRSVFRVMKSAEDRYKSALGPRPKQ